MTTATTTWTHNCSISTFSFSSAATHSGNNAERSNAPHGSALSTSKGARGGFWRVRSPQYSRPRRRFAFRAPSWVGLWCGFDAERKFASSAGGHVRARIPRRTCNRPPMPGSVRREARIAWRRCQLPFPHELLGSFRQQTRPRPAPRGAGQSSGLPQASQYG